MPDQNRHAQPDRIKPDHTGPRPPDRAPPDQKAPDRNRHVTPDVAPTSPTTTASPNPVIPYAFRASPRLNRPALMNPDLTFLNRLPCHA